jgi:two-component system cell cycle sensor histidine kinase/response regulator CckA
MAEGMLTPESTVLASIRSYAARLTAQPRPSLSVLVVDDEEPVRRFVERVLAEAGHQAVTAADGVSAIEAAQKMAKLDLLLTDVNMPEMSGDELARRLRHREPSLKVLYLTGYSDSLFKERSTLWQDEAFLEKPCSVKGLMQAVSLISFGRLEAAG